MLTLIAVTAVCLLGIVVLGSALFKLERSHHTSPMMQGPEYRVEGRK